MCSLGRNKLIFLSDLAKIIKTCFFMAQVSDWIDEEASIDTEVTILDGKLKELTDLTATLFARIREHTDRPEALDALNRMLNSSEYFLGKARNSSSVADGYFTEVELETLEKKVADIKAWKENVEKDQKEQPMWEMPKLTTRYVVAVKLGRFAPKNFSIRKA